jgi:predicted nucleic acid-binding Zn ribbon protein
MMKSLGEILKKQMPVMPAGKQITATMVVAKANEAIIALCGAGAAKFAQAIYYKDKTIAITCLSSVTAQEIKLNERQIIAEINKKLEGKAVEKIRYLI